MIKLELGKKKYTYTGLGMAGQPISKLGRFFTKYVPHTMPIFEKKSLPTRPVECLKLCLIFYVMLVLHKKIRQSLENVMHNF